MRQKHVKYVLEILTNLPFTTVNESIERMLSALSVEENLIRSGGVENIFCMSTLFIIQSGNL